jgi:methyl-accepting chemotaxis protein
MGRDILNCLVKVAPYLRNFFVDDFGVLVVDREKVLAYHPGERVAADIKPGDPINPEWAVERAMESKKKIVDEFDASIIGIPYIGIGYPIFDDDGKEVIGAIAISQATDRKEKLLKVAQELNDYIEFLISSLEEISAEAEEIAATGEELNSISDETNDKVKKSEEIVSMVQQISEDINIIGLNAMIEAARVGEKGRGFTVVANEVQRLANNAAESIKNVEKIFNDIKDVTGQLYEAAVQISQVTTSQAEKLIELNEKVKQLTDLGNEVVNLAESLSREE